MLKTWSRKMNLLLLYHLKRNSSLKYISETNLLSFLQFFQKYVSILATSVCQPLTSVLKQKIFCSCNLAPKHPEFNSYKIHTILKIKLHGIHAGKNPEENDLALTNVPYSGAAWNSNSTTSNHLQFFV